MSCNYIVCHGHGICTGGHVERLRIIVMVMVMTLSHEGSEGHNGGCGIIYFVI